LFFIRFLEFGNPPMKTEKYAKFSLFQMQTKTVSFRNWDIIFFFRVAVDPVYEKVERGEGRGGEGSALEHNSPAPSASFY